jgi:hypothetical protein
VNPDSDNFLAGYVICDKLPIRSARETMLEVTIQVPEPLAAEVAAARDRLPEILSYGLQQLPPLPNEVYQYVLEFLISQPSPE